MIVVNITASVNGLVIARPMGLHRNELVICRMESLESRLDMSSVYNMSYFFIDEGALYNIHNSKY